MDEPDKTCWCASLPAIMPLDEEGDCLCSDCLALTIAERIEVLTATAGIEQLVALAAPFRGGELHRHIDYEIEDGKYVFSRWFLLKRGYCCGNGCRHCPYGHVAVAPLAHKV